MACDGWKDTFREPEACLRLTANRVITAWMPTSNHFGPDDIHPGAGHLRPGTILQVGRWGDVGPDLEKTVLTFEDGSTGELRPGDIPPIRWINVYPAGDSPIKAEALRALTPDDEQFPIKAEKKMKKWADLLLGGPKMRTAGRHSVRARQVHRGLEEPKLIVVVWHDPVQGYHLRTRGPCQQDEYEFYFLGPMHVQTYTERMQPAPQLLETFANVKAIEIKQDSDEIEGFDLAACGIRPEHDDGNKHIGMHQDPPWPTEP